MKKIWYINYSFESKFNTNNLLVACGLWKICPQATSCVTLRRTSDSDVQTFGFIGDNLDTSSITTWAGASQIRVVKLWNQGAGGATYDVFQNTAGNQPILNLSGSVALINFTTSQLLLRTANIGNQTKFILDKNSIALVAFVSQSGTNNGGVLGNHDNVTGGGLKRVSIFSDRRSVNPSAPSPVLVNYNPTSSNFIILPTQLTSLTNYVASYRRVNNDISGYMDNILISAINNSGNVGSILESYITYGIQTAGPVNFDGQSNAFIMHDNELTESVLLELGTILKNKQ
jgi:hypothetical protein